MGAERKNCVMSIELAMQREMAYRQKLEKLGAKRSGSISSTTINSCWKYHLPSQVPAPTSSQAQSYFGPRPGQTPLPWPNTWQQVRAPGPTPFARHPFRGTRSRPIRPLGSTRSAGQKRKPVPGVSYFCDRCQVDCNNPFNLSMHLKGKKHNGILEDRTGTNTKAPGQTTGVSEKFHCELCGVFCSNEFAFSQHKKGKNHFFRLHASKKNKNE